MSKCNVWPHIILYTKSHINFAFVFDSDLYSGPVVGLRAVRILHDLDVAGKKLVAKVDAKNKLLLDNYKEEEEERNKGNEDSSEAHEKKEDADVFDTIQQILNDYRAEIDNFEAIQGKQCKLFENESIFEFIQNL